MFHKLRYNDPRCSNKAAAIAVSTFVEPTAACVESSSDDSYTTLVCTAQQELCSSCGRRRAVVRRATLAWRMSLLYCVAKCLMPLVLTIASACCTHIASSSTGATLFQPRQGHTPCLLSLAKHTQHLLQELPCSHRCVVVLQACISQPGRELPAPDHVDCCRVPTSLSLSLSFPAVQPDMTGFPLIRLDHVPLLSVPLLHRAGAELTALLASIPPQVALTSPHLTSLHFLTQSSPFTSFTLTSHSKLGQLGSCSHTPSANWLPWTMNLLDARPLTE